MNSDKCIFISNTMRAGSSYLSRILSAHPEISMSYDTVNFFRFCHHKYDPIENQDNFVQLLKDMAFRMENRFGIPFDVEKCLGYIDGKGYSYATAYWGVLRTIFPDEKVSMLGDKEALAWTRIPAFLEMFPKGKAIILVRDPRDVVNSFKKITIAPENDYLISLFDCVDAINHAVRLSTRYPDNVCMVKFEELKTETRKVVTELCAFLEIDFTEDMLDLDKYTDHHGKKWNSIKSRSCPEEKDPLAAVGRWKSKIDSDDLFLCEWVARKQIGMIDLPLSGRKTSQEDFNRGLEKLMSSELLRHAFKQWCETGEGVEKFPLDPTNPKNWDPGGNKNPDLFVKVGQ